MKKFIYLIVAITLMVVATPVKAQVVVMTSEFGLASDTAVDATTIYLQNTVALKSRGIVTVAVSVVKNSGTVGGTITLQGSLDGVKYAPITTTESQTALPTITAANATTNYTWRLVDNYYPYYRVSHVCTGTMNATESAKIQVKKL